MSSLSQKRRLQKLEAILQSQTVSEDDIFWHKTIYENEDGSDGPFYMMAGFGKGVPAMFSNEGETEEDFRQRVLASVGLPVHILRKSH